MFKEVWKQNKKHGHIFIDKDTDTTKILSQGNYSILQVLITKSKRYWRPNKQRFV